MRDDRFLTCTSCGTRFGSPTQMNADAPALCPGCHLILPDTGRQRGVIKFKNKRKGWGFITQPDGKEVFFHRSAVSLDAEPFLQEGELVSTAFRSVAVRRPLKCRLIVANPVVA